MRGPQPIFTTVLLSLGSPDDPMRLFSRVFLSAVATLLLIAPAQAQRSGQSSDVAGVMPQSDGSGALTQSDLIVFQSDESRIRLNDIAGRLSTALQEGRLGRSVATVDAPLMVPSTLTDLFLGSSHGSAKPAARDVVRILVARGLSSGDATRLGRAVAGLLHDGTVDPKQVHDALRAYNQTVERAPAPFLGNPPTEFLVVRAVLTSLLHGSADT